MTTFTIGDRVTKRSGSEWSGRVCGFYSTTLTPDGVCVESEHHAGSVQIYPAKALELVSHGLLGPNLQWTDTLCGPAISTT